MARVVVFAGGSVGLKVLKHLRESGDEILRVHTAGDTEYAKKAARAAGLSTHGLDIQKADFAGLNIDFMLTVYWPRLLKPEIFSLAKCGCINFHPALLPVNRGWYPHVHSILDGTPAGVTLHLIDEGADTGPVLTQKKINILPTDNAGDIYSRLQDEIFDLFRESWPAIKDGIKAIAQDESKAIYHKKSEIDALDSIDLEKSYRARDLINLLRARSFGPRGYAYFEDGGRVYARLQLNRTGVFE